MSSEDAYALLESVCEEMDLVFAAPRYPWRVTLTAEQVVLLRTLDAPGIRPSWREKDMFYERDGHLFLRAWDNERIPFVVHYRVEVVDNDAASRDVALDEARDPDVKAKYAADWERHRNRKEPAD